MHLTYLDELRRRADRLMLALVGIMLLLSLGMAIGTGSWASFIAIGLPTGVVCVVQMVLNPGALWTRLTMAAAFMVLSALTIHQAQGMIEMHFSIFVLLAILLYYRDWVPVVFAAALIAVHHLLFDYLQRQGAPIWVFASNTGFHIVLIHAAFVVAETVVLVLMARGLKREIDLVGASPRRLIEVARRSAQGLSADTQSLGRVRADSIAAAVIRSADLNKSALAEIGEVVDAVANGRFDRRLQLDGKQGLFAAISESINRSCQQLENVLVATTVAAERLAAGELGAPVEMPASGRLQTLRDSINALQSSLGEFIGHQQRALGAARCGDTAYRIGTDQMRGFHSQLADGMNAMLGVFGDLIDDVEASLQAMAAGDLTRRMRSDYEGRYRRLAESADSTASSMADALGVIDAANEAIQAAAAEVAAGSADLSARTEQQAAALEATAASMEELTSTVRGTAENAQQANKLSQAASATADSGGAAVGRLISTMGEIDAQGRKIEDIIGVIDGIAFQTNILALNAAVEAARAGEQGRGFAVVAAEVRALAQRSATAAREIKALIGESVEKSRSGAELAQGAGATMRDLLAAVRRVSSLMGEISTAAVEQSSGIEQVNQTVVHLDEGTQRNASLVEESSAAARSLQDQSALLKRSVSRFRR